MLRYCTSSCTSSHTWCYATVFFCISSHTWCYATVRLLALPHIHDATLLYFSAFPHIHDATLLYVFLHFLTYMMLRYCTSSCTSSLRKRRRSGALSVHTGTIDNAWRLLKQAVPKSLASKKGHTYNPALIKHCRSWQWRWKNTGTSLFQKTAKVLNETVQSRWLSLAIEKNARRNVLKPAYFKKTAKKSLMNAENIAKRTKKAKTQWHGEYHELNCLPKPCVSHPMSRIWTPKTDKTWVQFPTRRDVLAQSMQINWFLCSRELSYRETVITLASPHVADSGAIILSLLVASPFFWLSPHVYCENHQL